MNHFFVFERSDGGISIVVPSEGSRREEETEEDWLLRVKEKTVTSLPHLKNAKELSTNILPSNRRFRNCWRDPGDGTVKVDMTLARGQRMAEIRTERGRRFAAFDAEWMKATGQKNAARADAVESVRQQLRDVPQNVDLEGIATPEELEAFQPEWPGV